MKFLLIDRAIAKYYVEYLFASFILRMSAASLRKRGRSINERWNDAGFNYRQPLVKSLEESGCCCVNTLRASSTFQKPRNIECKLVLLVVTQIVLKVVSLNL